MSGLFLWLTSMMDIAVSLSMRKKKWAEIKNGFTHFSDGDIAVAKISPCLENLKSMILKDLPNGVGAGTTELYVFRALYTSSEYSLYFFKSNIFVRKNVVPLRHSVQELVILIEMTTIKKRKRFACPYCGKRLQLKNMFTTKETFVCRGCGRELKVKKQVVPFKWGFFIAFAPIVILGNILRLNGVSFFDNMLILLGLGIVIISIICLVVYLYSEYE